MRIPLLTIPHRCRALSSYSIEAELKTCCAVSEVTHARDVWHCILSKRWLTRRALGLRLCSQLSECPTVIRALVNLPTQGASGEYPQVIQLSRSLPLCLCCKEESRLLPPSRRDLDLYRRSLPVSRP